jgi:hypothetical protein
MPYCEICGRELNEGESCPACGKSAEKSEIPAGDGLFWTTKAPMITSRPVVTQVIIAFGGGFVFVMALLLILDVETAMSAAPYVLATAVFIIVLGLIIAAAMQFFTKGGMTTDFAITPEGIGYRAGKESKAINRATLAGTAVGGSLAGAGGSMINISREMDFMRWDEVKSITVYPRERSLVFYRRALIFPFALYCTPENFEQVKTLAKQYAPHARYREKRW